MYAVFVDFKKAFDSVCRQALYFKVAKIGVTGNFYGFLRNMCIQIRSLIFNWLVILTINLLWQKEPSKAILFHQICLKVLLQTIHSFLTSSIVLNFPKLI